MNKKIITVIIGVVLVGGAGTAYFVVNSTSTNTDNNQQRTLERRNQSEIGRFSASTTPVTIDDLQVGDEVTITGSSNVDGSMTAQSIIIGSIDFEPGQFGDGTGADGEGSGSRQMPGNFANRQPREGFTPSEGFNPEGGFSGGGQGGMPGGGARMQGGQGFGGGNMVRGEILDIDSSAITVALPDGGSRLVFYSSQTTITKVSEPEI